MGRDLSADLSTQCDSSLGNAGLDSLRKALGGVLGVSNKRELPMLATDAQR
jgi:hypothetical protein